MIRKGFALLELVIVLGIVVLLVGGGFYFGGGLTNQKSTVQVGNDAAQKAKQIERQMQIQAGQENGLIDQINNNKPSQTSTTVTTSSATSSIIKQ